MNFDISIEGATEVIKARPELLYLLEQYQAIPVNRKPYALREVVEFLHNRKQAKSGKCK